MYLKLQLTVLLLAAIARCEDDLHDSKAPKDNYPDESLNVAVGLQENGLAGPGAYGVVNVFDPLTGATIGGQLLGQQVEVTNQVVVPVVKFRSVPVPVPEPLPYPVPVPLRVPHPVPVPVYNKIPVPVEKPVHIIVEKPFPVKVVKEVPVPKPVPVPVPVYKTRHIHHIVHAHPKQHW